MLIAGASGEGKALFVKSPDQPESEQGRESARHEVGIMSISSHGHGPREVERRPEDRLA